jgi:hypothetical protein
MREHHDFVELARLCWRQAQVVQTEGLAHTLRQMATEYVEEAAKLDDRKIPNIDQGKRPLV